MKAKWRQHEIILVTMIAVFTIMRRIIWLFNGVPFIENFKFYHNILLLQGIILFLQYACYLWLNKLVIAKLALPKTLWQPVMAAVVNKTRIPVKPILLIIAKYFFIVAQFIIIIYLLGPVCNFAEFYCTQSFPDRGIVNLVDSIFPVHPQPFFNMFGGFDITLFFVGLYLLYTAVRETAIYSIEKQDGRKAYRVLIANQVTLFASVYFSVLAAISMFASVLRPGDAQSEILEVFIFVLPPVLTVAAVNIYWIFPSKSAARLFAGQRIGQLLLVTVICTLPVMLLHQAQVISPGLLFFGAWAAYMFIITPLSWLVYQQQKDKILQLRGMETALKQSQAGIQFLRSQINPHFLFNALNTLYGTALQDGSGRTAEGIQKLGDMMRFMLHDNNMDHIPMQREIEYLENYISLQKLRIQQSPNINIETHIDISLCTHQIAPMLFIPLVENAFKHGISLVERSWINITLVCDETTIRFTVGNSMHAKQGSDTEKDRGGIGLKNVSERLALLYPGRHTFNASGDGKEFVAKLHIQP